MSKQEFWKDAQGDDLPEIDREIVAIAKFGGGTRVVFAHRPNPEGWTGKNIDTDTVTHYTPQLYDKGGWNQPDVLWWLDLELPNLKQ